MNRYKNAVIALCFMASLYGTSNQEMFLRGNKAYQEGSYKEALECYEQIASKGNAVWHNMGNCCHKLERPVDACVYWKRAQHHAAHEDYCALETHIASLDMEVCEQQQEEPNTWLFWVRSYTASWPLLVVQIFTLLCWFIWCIVVSKRARWSISVVLGIVSLSLMWLSIDMQRQRSACYAVTMEETPVFVGPNASYHQQGSVKSVRAVRVTDEREGWYKIAYKELAGWVQADKLVKV